MTEAGQWREIRCPHCHKLLCKVRGGIAEIEISCVRCSSLVLWPDLLPVIVEEHEAPARPDPAISDSESYIK